MHYKQVMRCNAANEQTGMGENIGSFSIGADRFWAQIKQHHEHKSRHILISLVLRLSIEWADTRVELTDASFEGEQHITLIHDFHTYCVVVNAGPQ